MKQFIKPFIVVLPLIIIFFLYSAGLSLIFGETLGKGFELALIVVLLVFGLLTGYLWNESIVKKEEDVKYSFKEIIFYQSLGVITVIFWLFAIFLAIQN